MSRTYTTRDEPNTGVSKKRTHIAPVQIAVNLFPEEYFPVQTPSIVGAAEARARNTAARTKWMKDMPAGGARAHTSEGSSERAGRVAEITHTVGRRNQYFYVN